MRIISASVVTACAATVPATTPARRASHGPGEAVQQIFAHALPNEPGRSLVAVEVSYAPGGKSLPHHHAESAFIYAYVVTGAIRSRIEGRPAHVYRAGDSFFEAPGTHHLVAGNASGSEPAKLLAVFVVDTEDKTLTIPDR